MRTTLAALALTAGLATGAAALVIPSAALAADSATSTATTTPEAGTSERAATRLAGIEDALAGLVTDRTLTQAQADAVARTLAASDVLRGGGHGGHGGRGSHLSPDTVAGIVGISADELRTQTQAGRTLAQIAAAEGLDKADLVRRLVAAHEEQLAADVTAGRLTQAQADARVATLAADVAERVDRVMSGRGDRGATPDATATG